MLRARKRVKPEAAAVQYDEVSHSRHAMHPYQEPSLTSPNKHSEIWTYCVHVLKVRIERINPR